ncbi:MAG: phosphoribosylanthranilate isomerase [Armatimonadota bacterium]|nr:phosphoribosylanthranilate isomerase [Armatimonadota bacterium]
MPDSNRPFLKVCGLTRVADMRGAEAAGADFCGLIVEIERSPRRLARQQARLLARACRVRPVVVVEDLAPDEIARLVEATGAAAAQLHGGDAAYVRGVAEAVGEAAELWRPIGLAEEAEDRDAAVERAVGEIEAALDAGAVAIVLDTRTAHGAGGSGRTCDWEAAAAIVQRCEAPVILAGGLTPRNIAEALETTGAAGADLSSGVEREPGRKCPMLLGELARAWREVTSRQTG